MTKLPLTIAAVATLAACTTPAQVICDREAITYDKWGESAELPPECLPSPQGSLSLPTLERPKHDRDRPAPEPKQPDRPAPEPEQPEPEKPEKPEPEQPRGGPQGNNGLGNGDQTAPGGSGPNNNAENAKGNPGHPSGKPQNAN